MISPNSKKAVPYILMGILVLTAIGYVGYRQFADWHQRQLQTAVSQKQQEMAAKTIELEHKVEDLQKKIELLTPQPVPEEKMTEVGESPEPGPPKIEELNCEGLNRKITSFFEYLKQRPYVSSNSQWADPYGVFAVMAEKLSNSLPVVIGEMRDTYTILCNQSHFFRTLSKDNMDLVKKILSAEKDVLEDILAEFYAYNVTRNCCNNNEKACISQNTFYEYAGFFLQTLAGKGYLMRRSSNIRCLITYYSIMILDKSNDEKTNKYGIDIRPHIDLAIDDILNQKSLKFQDQYLITLSRLKEKYRLP